MREDRSSRCERFLITVRGISLNRRVVRSPLPLKIARGPVVGNALMQREFLQNSSNLRPMEQRFRFARARQVGERLLMSGLAEPSEVTIPIGLKTCPVAAAISSSRAARSRRVRGCRVVQIVCASSERSPACSAARRAAVGRVFHIFSSHRLR